MLTIELKLRLDGREVSVDKFLESIATQLSDRIRNEVRQAISCLPNPETASAKGNPAFSKRRALGVSEAANTLGLSEGSIRNYIRRGTLSAVKAGRRVLIPLESLEKALADGIPSETSRRK
jgi:excisionase family DNA binding protein